MQIIKTMQKKVFSVLTIIAMAITVIAPITFSPVKATSNNMISTLICDFEDASGNAPFRTGTAPTARLTTSTDATINSKVVTFQKNSSGTNADTNGSFVGFHTGITGTPAVTSLPAPNKASGELGYTFKAKGTGSFSANLIFSNGTINYSAKFDVTADWQTYYIPFSTIQNWAGGALSATDTFDNFTAFGGSFPINVFMRIILNNTYAANLYSGFVTPAAGSVLSFDDFGYYKNNTTYHLDVSSADTKMGTATGSGDFSQGGSATATATAKDGYAFVNWTDGSGNEISKLSSYTFTINSDTTLIANFKSGYQMSTVINNFEDSSGNAPFRTASLATNVRLTTSTDTTLNSKVVTFQKNSLGTNADTNGAFVGFHTGITGTPAVTSLPAPNKAGGDLGYTFKAKGTSSFSTNLIFSNGSVNYSAKFDVTTDWQTYYIPFSTIQNWAGGALSTTDTFDNFTAFGGSFPTNLFMRIVLNNTYAGNLYAGFVNPSTGSGLSFDDFGYYKVQAASCMVIANTSDSAKGTVSGGGSYSIGSDATVTATAKPGYAFDKWTKNDGSTASRSVAYTFTVTETVSLTANFVLESERTLGISTMIDDFQTAAPWRTGNLGTNVQLVVSDDADLNSKVVKFEKGTNSADKPNADPHGNFVGHHSSISGATLLPDIKLSNGKLAKNEEGVALKAKGSSVATAVLVFSDGSAVFYSVPIQLTTEWKQYYFKFSEIMKYESSVWSTTVSLADRKNSNIPVGPGGMFLRLSFDGDYGSSQYSGYILPPDGFTMSMDDFGYYSDLSAGIDPTVEVSTAIDDFESAVAYRTASLSPNVTLTAVQDTELNSKIISFEKGANSAGHTNADTNGSFVGHHTSIAGAAVLPNIKLAQNAGDFNESGITFIAKGSSVFTAVLVFTDGSNNFTAPIQLTTSYKQYYIPFNKIYKYSSQIWDANTTLDARVNAQSNAKVGPGGMFMRIVLNSSFGSTVYENYIDAPTGAVMSLDDFGYYRKLSEIPPLEPLKPLPDVLPSGQAANLFNGKYKVAFNDDFDYANPYNWQAQWNAASGANGHILSASNPDNVKIKDGNLDLALKEELKFGQSYTAGRVESKDKFLYGYYEAKYKYPNVKTSHNSFWLMTSTAYSAGGDNWEIDINEGNITNKVSANYHYMKDGVPLNNGGIHVFNQTHGISPKDLTKEYVTFGLLLTRTKIYYYIDGVLVKYADNTFAKKAVPIRLTTALVDWVDNATPVFDSNLDNNSMKVDYVRYWTIDEDEMFNFDYTIKEEETTFPETDNTSSQTNTSSKSGEITNETPTTNVEQITLAQIQDIIKNTEGNIVGIRIKNSGVFTKEMQQAFKDAGKQAKFEIADESGNVQLIWMFGNFDTIENDIDLSYSDESPNKDRLEGFAKTYLGSQTITLNYHGALPTGTKLLVKNTQNFVKGDNLELYYYNSETDKFEKQTGKVMFTADKQYFGFDVTHASDYIVVKSNAFNTTSSDTTTEAPKENGNQFIVFAIIFGFLVLAGATTFFIIKKKSEPKED